MKYLCRVLAIMLSAILVTGTPCNVEANEKNEYLIEWLDENSEYNSENLIYVGLPENIDFDIVTIHGYGTGIVDSDWYKVSNLSAVDIVVKIDSIYIQVADSLNFNISTSPELPESGNNIYMELISNIEGFSERFVLTEEPSAVPFSFLLQAGEEFEFKFQGTANEKGEIPWGTENIHAHIIFDISPYAESSEAHEPKVIYSDGGYESISEEITVDEHEVISNVVNVESEDAVIEEEGDDIPALDKELAEDIQVLDVEEMEDTITEAEEMGDRNIADVSDDNSNTATDNDSTSSSLYEQESYPTPDINESYSVGNEVDS